VQVCGGGKILIFVSSTLGFYQEILSETFGKPQ